MINIVYRLISPKLFEEAYDEIDVNKDVVVRPTFLSICKADQRYYQGERSSDVLDEKLPMALIHEGIGEVVYDNNGEFDVGDNVVMIPNTPVESDEYISENYLESSKFRASGYDGFTADLINIKNDRLVKLPDDFDFEVSSFIELISVAFHGINRFEKIATTKMDRLGVWGDGSLGYITALLLKTLYPNSEIYVFGKHMENLNLFSFADKTFKINEVPDDLKIDHAFECVGSQAAQSAIDQIINCLNPQGVISLFGVSEYQIPINTRLILEKGLTIVGNSRSGREDFIEVISLLQDNPNLFKYLSNLIIDTIEINSLDDLKEAFNRDHISNFGKIVLKWNK